MRLQLLPLTTASRQKFGPFLNREKRELIVRSLSSRFKKTLFAVCAMFVSVFSLLFAVFAVFVSVFPLFPLC